MLRHPRGNNLFKRSAKFSYSIVKLWILYVHLYNMYKWHVHSAIGLSRPLTNDFVRAVDGIAASLRQFSISVSNAAQDGGPYSQLQCCSLS
jgi:hypothetical protein